MKASGTLFGTPNQPKSTEMMVLFWLKSLKRSDPFTQPRYRSLVWSDCAVI